MSFVDQLVAGLVHERHSRLVRLHLLLERLELVLEHLDVLHVTRKLHGVQAVKAVRERNKRLALSHKLRETNRLTMIKLTSSPFR